jgi:hypothetical protein
MTSRLTRDPADLDSIVWPQAGHAASMSYHPGRAGDTVLRDGPADPPSFYQLSIPAGRVPSPVAPASGLPCSRAPLVHPSESFDSMSLDR